jgi:hypothetical protein
VVAPKGDASVKTVTVYAVFGVNLSWRNTHDGDGLEITPVSATTVTLVAAETIARYVCKEQHVNVVHSSV